jgi:hypothetical protein
LSQFFTLSILHHPYLLFTFQITILCLILYLAQKIFFSPLLLFYLLCAIIIPIHFIHFTFIEETFYELRKLITQIPFQTQSSSPQTQSLPSHSRQIHFKGKLFFHQSKWCLRIAPQKHAQTISTTQKVQKTQQQNRKQHGCHKQDNLWIRFHNCHQNMFQFLLQIIRLTPKAWLNNFSLDKKEVQNLNGRTTQTAYVIVTTHTIRNRETIRLKIQ